MQKSKILLVDDEKTDVALVKAILGRYDYELFEAYGGQEAIDLVRSVSPDLILMDVIMPGLSGFEACKILKEDPKWKSIPIIMVTALNKTPDKVTAMESGADDFIPKPVDIPTLVIRTKSLLRIKSYRDEIVLQAKQIEAQNKKLKELENIKDSLIHMIVHDINNLIMAVSSNLELMALNESQFSENAARSLKNSLSQTFELSSMVNGLLDVYKMEQGRLKLEKQPTDMVELIKSVLENFQQVATRQDISFNFNSFSNNFMAVIDPMIMKRVVTNILSNALHYSPKKSQIFIDLEPAESKRHATLTICDEGCGIDPQFHLKIFEKFGQVGAKKDPRNRRGVGLGLAFCKMAMEAHGGEIWVDNKGKGCGCAFHLDIPDGIASR